MIGMGRQSQLVNMRQFLTMPDVQLVAVCDVDAWRLETAKAAIEEAYGKQKGSGVWRGCDAFVEFRDLLARRDIDAVMISTPDRWQGPAPRAEYHQERVHPPKELGRPGWMRVLWYCDGMVTNWGTHLNDIAQWGNNTERTGPAEIEGRGLYPAAGRLWNVLRGIDRPQNRNEDQSH